MVWTDLCKQVGDIHNATLCDVITQPSWMLWAQLMLKSSPPVAIIVTIGTFILGVMTVTRKKLWCHSDRALQNGQMLRRLRERWRFLGILQELGKQFSSEDIRSAKHLLNASNLAFDNMKTGKDILFAIDEISRKENEDTVSVTYDFLNALENKQILSIFVQLTNLAQLQQREESVQSQNDNSTVVFARHPQIVASLKRSTLQGINSSHLSPIFQVVSSFMQGDAQGTIHYIDKFLQTRSVKYLESDGMELESVYLSHCTFNGSSLRCLLNPDICSHIEKTVFLRILFALSYRQTDNHQQTDWLLDLMSPAEGAFCRARVYGEYNNYQQQNHCQALLDDIDQMKLSHFECYRQQALLHDTLGILQGKDPRQLDIHRLHCKKQLHDTAIQIREKIFSQAACDGLDRVLVQLDAYTSLQSAGYARAVLSCNDVSIPPNGRVALAKEAEFMHSQSMAEQEQLLAVVGVASRDQGHTPSMLAARFDNMLRGLRIQQLSCLLLSPSFACQNDMLHHVNTQMAVIVEEFSCIPCHWLDEKIIALKEGMLSRIKFLEVQIMSQIIQAFALDNPYIPE